MNKISITNINIKSVIASFEVEGITASNDVLEYIKKRENNSVNVKLEMVLSKVS